MGVDQAAHGFVKRPDLVDDFFLAQHATGQDIVVSGQVLGGAVGDQVDAELQGPLVEGRGKGGVDDGHDMVPPSDLVELHQVKDVQVGVGGRLGEDEAGVGLDAGLQGLVIAERHDGALDAEALQI